MQVQINSFQRRVKINKQAVSEITEKILRAEKKKDFREDFEISINFVNDRRIRAINKEYLGHDYFTDVISFALTEGEDTQFCPFALGDIFISIDTAQRQANLYETSLRDELLLYLIHGVLHILSYDDIDSENRKIMKRKENFYFKKFKASYKLAPDMKIW